MKNEKMNKALGMLDEDIIADALEGKRSGGVVISRRKLMTALIAATLAVAILASTLMIALRRNVGEERVDILPPVGVTVIKNVASSAQITGELETSYGSYPTVESSEYWTVGDPVSYTNVGGLEMSDSLYNDLVNSNDANRIWSIEVSISPNLYITKDYLALQFESMLSEVTANHLETFVSLYEQAKENFDIDAVYEQYKGLFAIEDLYKYFKSGELDRDLLNADVEAMTNKAREILDKCGEIREDFWSELEPIVVSEIEKLGVSFVKDGDSYVIFVTEGELMSLSGIEGLKFDNAYYKINVNDFDPTAVTERAGKKVAKRLADAFEQNSDEDVLFAVLVESAGVAEIGNKSVYEQEYLALFTDLAARKTIETALRDAVAGGEKLDRAVAICGQETVDKYIKNGVFDSELFASDTASMKSRFEIMKNKLYGDASAEIYDTFRNAVRYIEITADGAVVIYVTAAEFDAMTVEGDFVYKLAA